MKDLSLLICGEIRYYKDGKKEIIKPSILNDIHDIVYSELK